MSSGNTSIHISVALPAEEFLVSHRGIPVGRMRARVIEGALICGELRAEAGYDGIRDLIRQASASLWAVGFLAKSPAQPQPVFPAAAVSRAAELPLELQDELGALVWTDFVNIIELPNPAELPMVIARLRLAPARTAARVA